MIEAITNDQLRGLLRSLAFKRVPHAGYDCFEHNDSGTFIALARCDSSQPAPETDVGTVRQHLCRRGLLTSSAFDAFLETGELRLPATGTDGI